MNRRLLVRGVSSGDGQQAGINVPLMPGNWPDRGMAREQLAALDALQTRYRITPHDAWEALRTGGLDVCVAMLACSALPIMVARLGGML
jgi:hypothetical protein